jgi:hypothetical protein
MKPVHRISLTLLAVLLLLSFPLALFAGTTYDQTVREGEMDATVFVPSRVPLIDPPVFDIPLKLYSPPLQGAHTTRFRMIQEGDRLMQIGKDVSTIFDLGVRTVTLVQNKTRSYTVETLEAAQQRLGAILQPSFWDINKYDVEVQKTGRTRQIEGQTAQEYRIIAIGLERGGRRVAASSVYWIVPKAPSEELAAFLSKWSRASRLPFPGMPPSDHSAFGVMAQAASKLGGFPIVYVVESRPIPGAEQLARLAGISPSPSSNDTARPQPDRPSPNPEEQAGAARQMQIRVTEKAFSNFSVGTVEPSAFVVPAAYRRN